MTTKIETDLLLKVLSQGQELMLTGKEINRTHEYNVQTHTMKDFVRFVLS